MTDREIQKRIVLVTGSRVVDPVYAAEMAESALEFEVELHGPGNVLLVHGAAQGWDEAYAWEGDRLGIRVRAFPASEYPNPLERNEDMVRFCVWIKEKYPTASVVCWAHARDRKSGTGHCARRARKAGIPTTDFGVSTE